MENALEEGGMEARGRLLQWLTGEDGSGLDGGCGGGEEGQIEQQVKRQE